MSDQLATKHAKEANAQKAGMMAARGGNTEGMASLPFGSVALLAELDKAAVLGLTESRAKQHRLEGKVATFDVVFEYNKTVEHWQQQQRPSTKKLAHTLYRIAAFMVEFSESVSNAIVAADNLLSESPHPPFIRRNLDFEGAGNVTDPGLNEIGIFNYRFMIPREFAGDVSSAHASKDGGGGGGGGGGFLAALKAAAAKNAGEGGGSSSGMLSRASP